MTRQELIANLDAWLNRPFVDWDGKDDEELLRLAIEELKRTDTAEGRHES